MVKVFTIALLVTVAGCVHRQIAPAQPPDKWTDVMVLQETADITFELRDDPALADSPPAHWFAGHPERDDLIANAIRLHHERAGE